MSAAVDEEARPLAVVVHVKERSTVSGLRFGIVEELLPDDAPARHRALPPKLGAEDGVPLLFDPELAD